MFFDVFLELSDYMLPVMEFISLLFLLVLGFESLFQNRDNSLKSKLNRVGFLLTIAALIIEVESYVFDGVIELSALTFICNTLSFACGSWIIAAFMFYISAIINETENVGYTHAKIVLVLAILESIMAIIGAFLGKTFTYYDAVYEPGPWIDMLSMMQMVFIIYVFIFIVLNWKKFNKRDGFVAGVYITFTIVTTLMEIYFTDLPSFYFVGQALSMSIVYVKDRISLKEQLSSEEIERVRTLAVVSSMADDFDYIACINIKTNEIRRYRASDKFKHVSDLIPADITGRKRLREFLNIIIHPEDKEKLFSEISLEKIKAILDTKEAFNYDCRTVNPVDDKVEYYRLKFAEVPNEQDWIIIGLISIDMQVQRDMEIAVLEERAKNQKELADSLQMIAGLATEYTALYHINLDTGEYRNYSISDKLADTKANFVKFDKFYDLFIAFVDSPAVHPDDRDDLRSIYLSDDHVREELRGIKKLSKLFRRNYDGTYLWTQMEIVKYEDIDEDPHNLAIGFIEKDAEVKDEMERQKVLEESLAMAQSANRAKTTFLNNMSHDIRTPMNAIIGYTGLAASHIDNQELLQDYLTKIGQSSDHLLSLINDVLDMSRIESGKMNIEEKKEDLSEIIHTLRNIVQADVHSKELDFFIDTVDVTDECVICDKLRLNQVLLNILSNAIKYTPVGGTVSLRITQKRVSDNGYGEYEFVVKDNGMGMSEEFLKTIFEPFTRVKSSTVSGIQGTGLGMAITKNIIDMMGGTIEIKSKENEGTEVTINFKFKLAGAPKEPERIVELEGLRSLVVDDDTNTCRSISRMLLDAGMRSEWCASGKEAIIRTEDAMQLNDLFKVYIIDWMMPDMNGIETTRRIRRVVGDEAPIIVLTAYDWSDVEDEAREAGVTAFISKPLFPSDLHSVLRKCVNGTDDEEFAKHEDYNFEGKKILLVEDNEMNREIAQEILEESGFEVAIAEDGDIAVDKVMNNPQEYDLILMDIQMPRMNGYEATRRIRKLPLGDKHLPIVAMTANAFEEDKKLALEAGMDEHIAKPIDVEKLKQTLAKYL